MNEKGLQQRFYAINKDGHVNGISLEKDHLDRISNQMELYETVTSNTNLCSNGKCNFNNIVKRGSLGNSCHTVLKINMNINFDDTTLETLKSLKNKEIDSKILPNYNNVDSILNTKNLYENSESISVVWNKLTNTYYEHIHEFSESESETFLANFNIVINEYKYMLSNSDYINNPLIQNITPEMIDSMETDLTIAYNYHYEHFDNNNNDNDDNVLKQYRMDYKKDSQSKLNREKFIHTLNSIVNLINQIEGNPISGLGTIYNGNTISSEINPNIIVSCSVYIKDAIDKLVEKIQSLDNSYNNELIDIYNNLSELYSINDMKYGLNQKTSINSELVHKLYNAVSEKLAIDNSLDENIKPSDNSLKVPGLERVENANLINTIKDNSVSNEDKMYILKGMEHQINNSPSKY
ncbi:hypothetical protein LY90DRAFT_210413 [Neocallimastix californiae]|uniref:Uncharacterized protein n=1 Tax=Neocallimastix californiae TaxID=1754190 RepID=A0A1Y1Z6L1_9FUNG|nr:hypothetical protein LY90DRAFT_210413 [Neocallimastix californiae]|eukprot:ORY05942.1 hypothetical protein LY90DRAFT_210413 [Neocallimastix californiae]